MKQYKTALSDMTRAEALLLETIEQLSLEHGLDYKTLLQDDKLQDRLAALLVTYMQVRNA
jgi:hypothetical protein